MIKHGHGHEQTGQCVYNLAVADGLLSVMSVSWHSSAVFHAVCLEYSKASNYCGKMNDLKSIEDCMCRISLQISPNVIEYFKIVTLHPFAFAIVLHSSKIT